ncbi:MAG TPA: excinuclease ABC subunit UvrC [Deltaproteobacteria bacterium]|nr:excinuclease ABC subunit UvrC [Deltaproteobacteria bacterium]
MSDTISEKLKRVPHSPGVYLMKDDQGEIIYVGKARDLRKRLASYFKNSNQWNMKVGVLSQKIADFDTIITRTEKEALILESNLIKRHRPRYNVVLKDDKRYPSLRLDPSTQYPNIAIVRKPQKDGALYFGPYASAQAVRETLNIVNKTFKLRKCKAKDFRKRARPCLHCQMQRCLAPCCTDVDPGFYDEMVKEAILFLKGRTSDLIRKIKADMVLSAEKQNYEKAARLRDKVFALEKTIEKQVAVTTDFKDRDIVAIARSTEISLITLLVVRRGYLTGVRHFDFSETIATDDDVIRAFIRQYYENSPWIPKEILLSAAVEDAALLEEWVSSLRGRRVRILTPKRGEKARLIALGLQNAKKELQEREATREAETDLLMRIQKRLRLQNIPRHIECFDNSNITGTSPVAAMVVFKNGKPDKSGYRKYGIKTVDTPDDYACMAEVMKRRYGKGEESKPYPDLLMVDGGKGQLNIAVFILNELGLSGIFDVVGIAKKDDKRNETEDKIYKPGRTNPIIFGREGDLLLVLQRIRNEAHRFAITFHRKRRQKTAFRSELDDVPGIGKKRKEALLKHFGGLENIRAATLEELNTLPGITDTVSASIKSRLKQ